MPATPSPAHRRKARHAARVADAERLLAELLDKRLGSPLPPDRSDDPAWYREARDRAEAKLREAAPGDAAGQGGRG